MFPALTLTAATARRRSRSSCADTYVSNDHGDALQEWLRAASASKVSEPLAVFHVDAHNDLNVPDSAVLSSVQPERFRQHLRHNDTLAQQLSASVDLANFQLAAVHAGLVNRIVWVRQSSSAGEAPVQHGVHRLWFDAATAAFEDEELTLSAVYDAEAEAAALGRAASEAGSGGVGYAFHEVPEHELPSSQWCTPSSQWCNPSSQWCNPPLSVLQART